jgi:hypothetical protein
MVFMFGSKDSKAASAATTLFNELKRAGKNSLELTALRSKSTNLAGADLLGKKDLETEKDISVYLTEKALPKRGIKAWVQRDADRPLVPVYLPQFPYLTLPHR